jgi:S1-C subfamily serine protease
VASGSPAGRGGLRVGDLIVAIDGQAVEDANAFNYRFATKPLGGVAKLGIIRSGRELTVSIALENAPDTSHEALTIQSRSPFQGAKVSSLSPAIADQLQLDPSAAGVVIVEVANGSPAQMVGFRPGDLIVSVNNRQITLPRELEQVAAEQARRWSITIRRGNQNISVMLGG